MSSSRRQSSDNFMYNAMLASALAQLLPCNERKIIRQWLEKLHGVTEHRQLQIRNDYMWFLLLTLQTKRITEPFSVAPFAGELDPLKDVLPPGVYDDTVASASGGENNFAWVEQVMSHGASTGDKPPLRHTTSTPPSQFLSHQPKPTSGIICYMGAFSDQHK